MSEQRHEVDALIVFLQKVPKELEGFVGVDTYLDTCYMASDSHFLFPFHEKRTDTLPVSALTPKCLINVSYNSK